MDLMEYQAKELFAKHGVPVTLGKTVETAAEARAAAEEIGGTVVVKAQVKAGGRGKAGGVKLAKTPDEAVATVGGGELLVDGKLDGIRVQVHRRSGEVSVYTRSLDEITERHHEQQAETIADLR